MDSCRIELARDRNEYLPGDQVEGTAYWAIDTEVYAPLEAIEIRVGWETNGWGQQDLYLCHVARITAPGSEGSQTFCVMLPHEPYTFSGSLVSLTWFVEIEPMPEGWPARRNIVVSPTRKPLQLWSSG